MARIGSTRGITIPFFLNPIEGARVAVVRSRRVRKSRVRGSRSGAPIGSLGTRPITPASSRRDLAGRAACVRRARVNVEPLRVPAYVSPHRHDILLSPLYTPSRGSYLRVTRYVTLAVLRVRAEPDDRLFPP